MTSSLLDIPQATTVEVLLVLLRKSFFRLHTIMGLFQRMIGW